MSSAGKRQIVQVKRMVFSDNIFLFFFLPLVLLCDRLCPKAHRNGVLLLFSLIFYAWGEPVYVLLMLLVILRSSVCSNTPASLWAWSKA